MSSCPSTSNFYFISGLIKMELRALYDLSHQPVRCSAFLQGRRCYKDDVQRSFLPSCNMLSNGLLQFKFLPQYQAPVAPCSPTVHYYNRWPLIVLGGQKPIYVFDCLLLKYKHKNGSKKIFYSKINFLIWHTITQGLRTLFHSS